MNLYTFYKGNFKMIIELLHIIYYIRSLVCIDCDYIHNTQCSNWGYVHVKCYIIFWIHLRYEHIYIIQKRKWNKFTKTYTKNYHFNFLTIQYKSNPILIKNFQNICSSYRIHETTFFHDIKLFLLYIYHPPI